MKHNKPRQLGLANRTGSGLLSAEEAGSCESRINVTALDRWLLRRVARTAGFPPVNLALWDGEDAYAPEGESVGRVTFRDRLALLGNPELGFGDCYVAGRIAIRGI